MTKRHTPSVPPPLPDRLLTVQEVAYRLGRTPDGIYGLVRRKQLRHRRDGKRVMFLESEINAYIADLPGLSADEEQRNRDRLGF